MKDAPRPWEEIPEVGSEFLMPRLDPGAAAVTEKSGGAREHGCSDGQEGNLFISRSRAPSHQEVQRWLLPLKGGVEGK